MSDDFSVLETISKAYVAEHIGGKIIDKFGLSYKSNSDKPFPKSGFVGFELKKANTKQIVKLQLYKDDKGWAVMGTLPNNQINDAHPLDLPETGHKRTDEGAKAKKVAGIYFEKLMQQQNKILSIRSTSTNCYLTKTADKASCTTTYGIVNDKEQQCLTLSTLTHKNKGDWQVVKEINFTQKVDYTSGELKDYKPFTPRCN